MGDESGRRDTSADEAAVDGDSGSCTRPAPDLDAMAARLDDLRTDVADLRETVDDRAVDRDAVQADLRRYVRRRQRAGHARGWGPYLVLLYGVAMTLGAFYWLGDTAPWAAVAAMVVVWLSTLGLYGLFVIVGWGMSLLGLLGRFRDAFRRFRS